MVFECQCHLALKTLYKYDLKGHSFCNVIDIYAGSHLDLIFLQNTKSVKIQHVDESLNIMHLITAVVNLRNILEVLQIHNKM